MKRSVWLAGLLAAGAAGAGSSGAAETGGFIPLMDGKTMAGWQASERPESWKLEDGTFVTRGDRSHLFYVGPVGHHDFKNLELAAEVMTEPGANSGIYVHTKLQGPGFPEAGYELQVINSNPPVTENAYVEHKMTGSIYAVRNTWKAPAKDNEWFRYRIRVVGKTIQTFIDDALVCEYAEPENPWRPADKKARLLGSGTVALQAHDPASVVHYRAIKVRMLPDDAAPPAGLVPVADRELDELITQFSNDNWPLIDLGLTPPEGPGADAFFSDLRRYGMTAGSVMPIEALRRYGRSVVIFNDHDQAPEALAIVGARAAGARVAFSGGAETTIDPARLKRRLQAIKAAAVSWRDFWVPGKN